MCPLRLRTRHSTTCSFLGCHIHERQVQRAIKAAARKVSLLLSASHSHTSSTESTVAVKSQSLSALSSREPLTTKVTNNREQVIKACRPPNPLGATRYLVSWKIPGASVASAPDALDALRHARRRGSVPFESPFWTITFPSPSAPRWFSTCCGSTAPTVKISMSG